MLRYWLASPHLKARQVAVRQCLRALHPAHLQALRVLSRVHRVPSLRAQEVRNRHKVPSQAALRAVVVRAPVVQCLQYQAQQRAANNKVPALPVLRPRMGVAVSPEIRALAPVLVKVQGRNLNLAHRPVVLPSQQVPSKVTQIRTMQATAQAGIQELNPASLVISSLWKMAIEMVHLQT